MQRPCDVCGEAYEAKRASSKFCSPKCRVAKARGAVTTHHEDISPEVASVASLPNADSEADGPVASAVLQELVAAEREKTALGQAGLALARRIDIGRDTGAGLASLVKQLEATVRAATADAKTERSPLDKARDELAARRAQRGA